MRTISPELEAPQLRVAEHQPEYLPVTVALVASPGFPTVPTRDGVRFNAVVMAFRPSDQERARLAAGADVYVSLMTFGRPQQPIIVTAGKEDMARAYNVRPTGDETPAVPAFAGRCTGTHVVVEQQFIREIERERDQLSHDCGNLLRESNQYERERDALREAAAVRLDAMEAAWGLIANAGGGDWSLESKDWQEAARRWSEQYNSHLGESLANRATDGAAADA